MKFVAFHDGLDFVSVHATLLEDLKLALASVRAKQSLEQQVDVITKAKASKLSSRRALQSVRQPRPCKPKPVPLIILCRSRSNS